MSLFYSIDDNELRVYDIYNFDSNMYGFADKDDFGSESLNEFISELMDKNNDDSFLNRVLNFSANYNSDNIITCDDIENLNDFISDLNSSHPGLDLPIINGNILRRRHLFEDIENCPYLEAIAKYLLKNIKCQFPDPKFAWIDICHFSEGHFKIAHYWNVNELSNSDKTTIKEMSSIKDLKRAYEKVRIYYF